MGGRSKLIATNSAAWFDGNSRKRVVTHIFVYITIIENLNEYYVYKFLRD